MKKRIFEVLTIMLILASTAVGQQSWNVDLIGHCGIPEGASDVFVSGNYAYVADDYAGLRIIDVSNPASPQEVGYYDTPGYAWGVTVSGGYAYVADHWDGLSIIDVSNPSSPQEVGNYDTPGDAWSVYISAAYAYVADKFDGLRIIDVSNPASPQEVGYYDTNDAALSVYISGGYAYVADNSDGLRIIDVSNPASPQEVGYYDTPGDAWGVTVSGGYAYVADYWDGLRIIDVSNPYSPQEVGYYDTPGPAMDVTISGGYAYVADRTAGLRIIDVSNPSNPQEVGYYYDTQGDARGVTVSGGYAYIADTYNGLYILQFHPSGSLAFSSTQLNFGSVNVGNSQQQIVTVSNNGSYDVTVSNAYISGGQASEFSLVSGGAPFTLAPSLSRDMVVEFAPQSAGTKQAYLILESNAPSSPDTVALTGAGVSQSQVLVAYYPFNGNANDESGNGHDGTVMGAMLAADRFNQPNRCYYFNGIDNYIELPEQENLFGLARDFSISLWFKIEGNQKESWLFNLENSTSAIPANNAGIFIGLDYNVYGPGKLDFFVGSGNYNSTNTKTYVTYENVFDNSWHHVVVTREASNARIYVDGHFVAENTNFHDLLNWNGASYEHDFYTIGAWKKRNQIDRYFAGYIDDIRVYNYPLTESEISQLYHENGWTGGTTFTGLPFFDDFSDNDDSDWQWIFTDNNPASDPSHQVVNGQEIIYTYDRQQTMLLNGADTLSNYTIEADVTITQGLDDANLKFFIYAYVSNGFNGNYYVFSAVSNSGTWSLGKMENGTGSTLATGPIDVSLNHTYHVKWEIQGLTHRIFIDGNLAGEATDPSPLNGGKFGIGGSDDVTVWDNISVYRTQHLVQIGGTPRPWAPLPIMVEPPDNFTPIISRLYYRPAGSTRWSYINLSPQGNVYVGEIPSQAIDLPGVQYYVYLSDGQTVITYPEVDPETHPAFIPVQVTRLNFPFWLSSRTYRMVSIPLQLQNNLPAAIFPDDFGEYDPASWRMFYWIPFYNDYQEYDDGLSHGLSMVPGTAVWLITHESGTFDVENGISVDATRPYNLTLSPGWNQIGNPFAFPVAWDSIGGSELVQAPVWWNGTEYEYNKTTLRPWEGYFVYNPTGQTVTLQVPPRESGNPFEKPALSANPSDGECLLQLSAEGQVSRQADRQNYLGLLKNASDGLDARDFLAAPPIEHTLTLEIVDGEHLYAGNFRSAGKEGAYWDLTLSSPRKEAVTITVSELSGMPEGFQYWLMDLDRRCLLLSDGTASVQISEAGQVRHLRLILGTPEFAKNSSESIPLVPLKFALHQNYPNPFNPETHITYQLPERSEVRLEIYNTLGQKVRTLVQGWQDTGTHTVVWDGRDEWGQLVASGVYLYVLQAGKKYRQTRKMMLMK